MLSFETIAFILASSIRLAVPLLLACLAGLWSERGGIVDISLEGKMLGAAFAAAVIAYLTGNAWAGLLGGIAASVVLALVHGFASIDQRGNQIVSGTAINLVAVGLTSLLGNAWFGQGGRTPALEGAGRFESLVWPGADALRPVPIIGPIYADIISGHDIITYIAFAVVPLTWFVLHKTRFGLRLRAVGENPAAVDTAGISVRRLRYAGVAICGVLCGFAGTYLAVAQSAGFIPQMTAGQGFIALAALVFAKWRPTPALATCLLFGFLNAAAIRLQGVSVPGIGEVPVQAIQALPYLLTVILLAGFIGRAIPPRASGIPYVKER
ncbi:MAG: ABC transporter permease [Methylobacteriaceae bacterium]|nr:ABC transporter permease [Methylobacteriaceae bacterium]MBV9633338.1 ABC transporter permease [Methylobacteriaceae bacterium]MBV9702529.1 ABC transporter permease [Methylobacteriaceae bacterium]